MGCGSSRTGQPPSAPTAAAQKVGGRQATKSVSVGIVTNSNSNNSNSNGGRRHMGSGRGDGILPADIGSPPPGGSHRASRVSIGGGGGGGRSGTVEASNAAAVAQSFRASRQSVRTPTAVQAPPPSSPPPSMPPPPTAPTNAAEKDASENQSWRDDLLGELNWQRRQVFSPDLVPLNLHSELCTVARREAQRLAGQRITVVSPAIDEEALTRSKAGVQCHAMSRVLTKEESLDLRLYLAGLMAAMKAKEEDLADWHQLKDSDAAFWTLNGSFGCALVNFDFQSDSESGAEIVKEEFAVLTMVFCPESCLDTITAATNAEQENDGQGIQADQLQQHRRQEQKEAADDDAAGDRGQSDYTLPVSQARAEEEEAVVVAAAAAAEEEKVAEKATTESEATATEEAMEAAAAESAEAAEAAEASEAAEAAETTAVAEAEAVASATSGADEAQETTVEANSQLADAEKTGHGGTDGQQ